MYASGENVLEVIIGELLRQRKYRLAVAESCTGGLIGHRITNIPGSSVYYAGSVTAYSYDIKELILHVRRETLDRYGAVSEQTAREMAQGVRRSFYADVGLAVTGIAGPGGGTAEKPVGLVYVALAAPDGEWAEQYVWRGNRRENKEHSAEAALDLLRRYLEARLSYS
jgi:PncC family amidohydrolase